MKYFSRNFNDLIQRYGLSRISWVTDLDGVLLPEADMRFQEDILDLCKKAGDILDGRFTYITGRPFLSVYSSLPGIAGMAENGSVEVFENGDREIRSQKLDCDPIIPAVTTAFKTAGLTVFDKDNRAALRTHVGLYPEVADCQFVIIASQSQLVSDPDVLDRVISVTNNVVKDQGLDEGYYVSSGADYVGIFPKGVSKDVTMRTLMDREPFKDTAILYFGDSGSDVEAGRVAAECGGAFQPVKIDAAGPGIWPKLSGRDEAVAVLSYFVETHEGKVYPSRVVQARSANGPK